VTVSDGERLRRGSLTAEERATWAVKAWRLADKFGLSFRAIEEKWEREEGFRVSHVSLRRWASDVRTQSKILELYEPAQVRLDLLGKYERNYEATQAAMDAGEIPFDVGMKLLLGISRDIAKLTNAAVMPTSRVEHVIEEHRPDAAILEELRRVTQHEQEMEEMESNDGLMD